MTKSSLVNLGRAVLRVMGMEAIKCVENGVGCAEIEMESIRSILKSWNE